MRKIWAVLRQEFRHTIRQKGYIIIVVSLPVIAIIGYAVAQIVQDMRESDAPGQLRVGYVDGAGVLKSDYPDPPEVGFYPFDNEADVREAFLAGAVDEYFLLDEDYMTTGLVLRYAREGHEEISAKAWVAMEHYLETSFLEGNVTSEVLERIDHESVE